MTTPFIRARTLALLSALPLAGCALSPTPFAEADLQVQAAARLERAATIRTPVSGTLTLPEAIQRAVQHNLDHQVEIYDIALRQAEIGTATAAMLPSLIAGASATRRDNVPASSSFNVLTNTQNFGASTSQDQNLRTGDLALSWNILDFGLSYVRARQTADKVLIAKENRRRVVHKLVEDVRTAYWRAYAAQHLHQRMVGLERRTQAALARSLKAASDRETSPVTAMTYRRELIEIQRSVRELHRELVSAKIQLATLINELPSATFRLAPPKGSGVGPEFTRPPSELIAIAMERRPELREISYRRRINAHELDAALLELLPGIQLFVGPNYDSNSFLLNEHWVSWGAKASWNLIRLFQYPLKREVIESQDALLEQRDRAMALTVMTQIHVSRARMAVMARELETAKNYATTQSGLLHHIRAEYSANRVSEQTLLREELNDVVGHIRKHLAEANLQSARAALAAAVGVDPPTYSEELPPLAPGNAAAWRTHTVLAGHGTR